MKRFLLLGAVILFLLTSIGVGQFAGATETAKRTSAPCVSEIVNELEFLSLEEFFVNYKAVSTGDAVGDLAKLAASVNLSALEKLYLPTGIPDGFQIYKITINKQSVGIWYLHKEDMLSEDTISTALWQQRHFLFCFTRWDLEDPLDGILKQRGVSRRSLIDGTYLFKEPNKFTWSADGEVLFMYTPQLSRNADGVLVTVRASADQAQFAKNSVVNLLDENEVNALIGIDQEKVSTTQEKKDDAQVTQQPVSPVINAYTTQFKLGTGTYSVNRQELDMDTFSYLENDRVYVPVRFLAYGLNIIDDNIDWDNDTREVTITKNNTVVKMKVESFLLYVNDVEVQMDVTPQMNQSNRVMLPARWVAEAFGAAVSWDETQEMVTIEFTEDA